MRTFRNPLLPKALIFVFLTSALVLRLESARTRQGLENFWRLNDWEYYGLGVQMADAGLYRAFPAWPQNTFRMPLYPAFISLSRQAFPGLGPLRYGQAILDFSALAGAVLVGISLGGIWCGVLTAVFGGLASVPIHQVARPQIESFYGFLIVAALAALVHWLNEPKKLARAALAGLCIGLSLFCRSTLAFFPPLLILLFLSTRHFDALGKHVALFIVCAYLPLIPWLARNRAVIGSTIVFEQGAASLNLWGASMGIIESPTMADLAASGRHKEFVAAVQRLPDAERYRVMQKLAFKNIREHPYQFAAGVLRRLPVLWSEQWLLVLLACTLLWARRARAPLAAAVCLAAYFNIYAFMGVQPRYARPIFYVMCVLAALGVRLLLDRRWPAESPLGKRRAGALGTYVLGSAMLGALVYLQAVTVLTNEIWKIDRSAVPREYQDSPERYTALKEIQARGIDLTVKGRLKEAEDVFSQELEMDQCSGEALLSRALTRDWLSEASGASRDYRQAALCLEFSGVASAEPTAAKRLDQY